MENRVVVLVQDISENALSGEIRKDRRDDDRREGSDGKIAKDDFQSEKDTADRGIEDRADSGGRTAADQDGHVLARDAEKLAETRSDGGSNLNDRAFST